MPKPHPLVDWRAEIQIVEDFERRRPPDDDQVGVWVKIIHTSDSLNVNWIIAG